MLKRILRETSLSIKRNSRKIILLSLVLLISSNLVFGALGIFKAVNEKMYEAKDFTKRHVQMEYIDLDLVDESSLNIHQTIPVFI